MLVLPAIDLKNGQSVRLYQGDFSKQTIIEPDPLKQALFFEEQGALYLHLVDLDGALNDTTINQSVIQKIRQQLKIPIEVGGGIRTLEQIKKYLDVGIDRVIIGSKAVSDLTFLEKAVALFGEKIAVGIDAKDGLVAVDGWKSITRLNFLTFAKEVADLGVQTIIYTDIAKDGTLQGPNIGHFQQLKNELPEVRLIASGGVTRRNDLIELAKLGLYGAITGRALYDGELTMQDVREVSALD